LNIVRRRRVRLAAVDPEPRPRPVDRPGLVRGGYEDAGQVPAHNRQLLEDLERWQRKVRRHEMLRGDAARYEFYDQRIGPMLRRPSFERGDAPRTKSSRGLLCHERGGSAGFRRASRSTWQRTPTR